MNRQFHAPALGRPRLSDFTYVATWRGFIHVPSVIDAYAWRIVGRRVSRTADASFVLDAWRRDSMVSGKPGAVLGSAHFGTKVAFGYPFCGAVWPAPLGFAGFGFSSRTNGFSTIK